MSKKFVKEDVQKLFLNKFIVVIGSSVQRSMYKDLVKMLRKDEYLSDKELRAKGEAKFEDDELIDGGLKTNSTTYREVREYKTDFHLIRFYFITRAYNEYVESIIESFKVDPKPDVVLLSSCLWDINRYGLGPESLVAYKQNVHKLMKKLKEVLDPSCLVIWNSTLPVDKEAKGGLFVSECESAKTHLGSKILGCNLFVHAIIKQYGFDYIDLHYFFRHHLQRMAADGIHWDMIAHRHMSNLFLSHIAESWGWTEFEETGFNVVSATGACKPPFTVQSFLAQKLTSIKAGVTKSSKNSTPLSTLYTQSSNIIQSSVGPVKRQRNRRRQRRKRNQENNHVYNGPLREHLPINSSRNKNYPPGWLKYNEEPDNMHTLPSHGDHYCRSQERFHPNQENCHPYQEDYHPYQDYHSHLENYHLDPENYHPDQEDYHSNWENDHSYQENYHHNHENYRPNEEIFHLNQENYHLDQENYHLDQENFHLDQENFHLDQENYRQYQENFHPYQEDYHLDEENYILDLENYHSNLENSQAANRYEDYNSNQFNENQFMNQVLTNIKKWNFNIRFDNDDFTQDTFFDQGQYSDSPHAQFQSAVNPDYQWHEYPTQHSEYFSSYETRGQACRQRYQPYSEFHQGTRYRHGLNRSSSLRI